VKACKGNGGMAPVIVNLAIDGGQRSPSRAGDFTIGYEPPNMWARSRCGRLEKKEFRVFVVAIRTPDFPGGSESLYRSRPCSNLRY